MKRSLVIVVLCASFAAVADDQYSCSFNNTYNPGNARLGTLPTTTRNESPQGFVQNYGDRLTDRPYAAMGAVGNFVIGNGTCSDASLEELTEIQCAGKAGNGYSFDVSSINIPAFVDHLDDSSEELVFLTAMEGVHDFARCQEGLFNSYFGNPQNQRDLEDNAFIALNQIVEAYYRLDNLRYTRERTGTHASDEWIQREISRLVSRVPMGNRDIMRDVFVDLIRGQAVRDPNDMFGQKRIPREVFQRVFREKMRLMSNQTQNTLNTIEGQKGPDGQRRGGLVHVINGQREYCIDTAMKTYLYRSGQVESTIQGQGLQAQLTPGFLCRANNRYSRVGGYTTDIALIPTYFLGYGAARLALRAGAAAIEASTATGELISGGARLMMLGLEGANWLSSAAAINNDCNMTEMFSRVTRRSCDPQTELDNVYQEATMSQCLTTSFISAAPLFVGPIARRLGLAGTSAEANAAIEAIEGAPSAPVGGAAASGGTVTARHIDFALSNERSAWIGAELRRAGIDPTRPLSERAAVGLTSEQRLFIIEGTSGAAFSKAQASILDDIVRDSAGGLDPRGIQRLRRVLIDAHVDPEDVDGIINQLIERKIVPPRRGTAAAATRDAETRRLRAEGESRPPRVDGDPPPRTPDTEPPAPPAKAASAAAPRVDVGPPSALGAFSEEAQAPLRRAGIEPESLLSPAANVADKELEKAITRFELEGRFRQWRDAGKADEIFNFLSGLRTVQDKRRYLAILLNSPAEDLPATLNRLKSFERDVARRSDYFRQMQRRIDELGDQISRRLPVTDANRAEILLLTRRRSAYLQETNLLSIGDDVEIVSIFSSRASNRAYEAKGPGYQGHSLDDTFSVDIQVKEGRELNVCRGSFAAPLASSTVTGNFTTFCRSTNLQSRNDISQFVAAPDDVARAASGVSGYDDFWRFRLTSSRDVDGTLRPARLSLGLNGPVTYTSDAQLGTGGIGGGIEFFGYRSPNPVTLDSLAARTRVPTCNPSECGRVFEIQANIQARNLANQSDVVSYLAHQRRMADSLITSLTSKSDQFIARLPSSDAEAVLMLKRDYGDVRSAYLVRREVDLRDASTPLGRLAQGSLDADAAIVRSMTQSSEAVGSRLTSAVGSTADLASAERAVLNVLNSSDVVTRYTILQSELQSSLRSLRAGGLNAAQRQDLMRKVVVDSALLEDMELPLQTLRYKAASWARTAPGVSSENQAALKAFIETTMTAPSGAARIPPN